MSIQYKVLGKPGRDNALFVWLNTGTKLYRILFDCGENIFYGLKQSDVKSIDYLFLSHLHIDHIAGFDYYFRRTFDREKPNFVWGPEETAEIIQNKLKGFKWNLIEESAGEFIISDISANSTTVCRFVTSESFSVKHRGSKHSFHSAGESFNSLVESNTVLMDNSNFTVRAVILNHRIPTIAYSLAEKDSINIDKEALFQSGLTPGNWLEKVRNYGFDEDIIIETDDKKYTVGELRSFLTRTSRGESICYLTDFVFDEDSRRNAIELTRGSDIIICESQYYYEDSELAEKNFHLTNRQAAEIAKEAGAGKLILFHISERYTTNRTHYKLLEDARTIFPETYFPEEWEASK